MFGYVVFIFFLFSIFYNLKLFMCDSMNRMCQKEEFHKPYVEILKQRGGIPIFTLQSACFIDLRNQYGVLLCVNGPAYLHINLELMENVTSTVPLLTIFKPAPSEIKFYKHECFLINRPVPPDLSNNPMDQSGNGTGAGQYHVIGVYPTDLLTPNITVHGVRAYGITLIGAKGDYNAPSMYMFLESKFGYNDQELVIASSYVTIGKNDWIAYDEFTNTSLTLRPAKDATDKSICFRPQGTEPFDTVFQRGHKRADYKWTMVNFTETPTNPPTTIAPVDPSRPSNLKSERVGRIIDPKLLGNGDSSGGGGNNGGDNNKTDGKYEFPIDFDKTIIKPHRYLLVETKDCKPLPIFEEKEPSCTSTGSTPEESCPVIYSILDLDVKDWSTEPTLKELAWKKEFINFIEEIFLNICPQISSRTIESVGKIFKDVYIAKAHGADQTIKKSPNPEWDLLKIELEHCKNDSTEMQFTEYEDNEVPPDEIVVPIPLPTFYLPPEDSEINSTSNSNSNSNIPPIIPILPKIKRKYKIKRHDGSHSSIFYYGEAAEADFEFNIAIDSQWKIFATVLGYCNKFYENDKKSNVYQRLMALFEDEFLSFNMKDWKIPKLNDIYMYIMRDSDGWLDNCLEGAYIHSDAEEFRPVRPMKINDDKHPNHFSKVPPHN